MTAAQRSAVRRLHAKARAVYLADRDYGLHWWDIAARCQLMLAYGRSEKLAGPAGRLP